MSKCWRVLKCLLKRLFSYYTLDAILIYNTYNASPAQGDLKGLFTDFTLGVHGTGLI